MSIRINRVYTRSGDSGETGLVGGARVSKSELRVHAYGDIDELNACIGCAKETLETSTEPLRALLGELQQQLFDLGAELATPVAQISAGMWQVKAEHSERLEKLCDQYGDKLPELQSFILPGGSKTAAELHRARTVARRAERTIVELSQEVGANFNAEIIKYTNRLSDLLFILSRWTLRAEGREEVLWVREAERQK